MNFLHYRAAVPAGFMLGLWLMDSAITLAGGPQMNVIKTAESGSELLLNGDFELSSGEILLDWTPGPKGFIGVPGEGRNGSQALRCDNPDEKGWHGASQTILLNRTNIMPLVFRGWSKAEAVNGGRDSDYSIYVDLLYNDGAPLWGQTANFRTGTHDWELRELVILPEKPVKSVTVHCLFRNHSGVAWFDEMSVSERRAE